MDRKPASRSIREVVKNAAIWGAGLYVVFGSIYAAYAYHTENLAFLPYSLIVRALFWPVWLFPAL